MKKSTLKAIVHASVISFLISLFSFSSSYAQTWGPKNTSVIANSGGFYEYLPLGYNDPGNSTKKWPVMLFIHGVGELGNGTTQLANITGVGLPYLITQGAFPKTFTVGGQTHSFIVIAPQFKAWPTVADVEGFLTYIQANYRVDVSRIYLTGLSMGGGVVWDYASSSTTASGKLAAIVPICGASAPASYKCQAMANTNLPVLATHNNDDGVVGVANTNLYVDGINAFNPNPLAIKIIWPTGGHNAWSSTYDPSNKLVGGTMNTYEWMLQYTRGGATPALSASISSSVNVSCNGGTNGTATATASGGKAPYTYSWSTSPVQTTATASGLAAGSYTVTVKDANNTTTTATVTITQPTKLSLTVTPGTITVNGGTTSVSLTASGGTAPYSYTGTTANVTAGTYTYTVTDAKGCTDTKTVTITEPAPAPLTVSLGSTVNVSCFGSSNGSAVATASGGKAPYTYSWSSSPVQTTASLSNVPAGVYTVTVRDANNITATASVTISQPAILDLNVTPGTITVNGGTTNVTLSATGGTAPYTYSGPTTNVAAGTYTYTVTDAKGCTISKSITITQPAPASPVILALGKQDVSCNGGTNGSATATPSGGTAPYTYSWSTSPVQTTATISNLKAGTYTVTVKDANNTTATSTVTITEPGLLSLNVSAGTITVPGGTTSVTLSAGGGTAPYSYAGPTTSLSAGTYNYTVTDSKGCTDMKTITLTEPTASSLTIVSLSHTDVTCNGAANGKASVVATGGTAPYTYSWNSSPVQATANASGLASGSYIVTVKDAAGKTVTGTVNISQPSTLVLNATAGTITSAGGTTNVSLTASGGTAPYAFTGTTTGLVAGTYTFGVTDANGCKTSTNITIADGKNVKLTAKPGNGGIKCKGGSCNVALTVEGGVAPYTFTGDTTTLTAGTYTYMVTDATGAQGSTTITITEPEALNLAATAPIITQIGGTTDVSLAAKGGTAPYSFTGSVKAVKAGTYNYQVKDANGCTAAAAAEVKEPGVDLSAFNLAATDTTVLIKWNTSYEFAIDRFEVEKAKDDKTFMFAAKDKSKGNGKGLKEYVQADPAQIAGSNTYKLYAITSFGEKILLGEKKLYFSGNGSIQIKNLVNRIDITLTSSREEKVTIQLFDILGRPVQRSVISKSGSVMRTSIDMSQLKSGIYVVKVSTASGMQTVKQVVKQ